MKKVFFLRALVFLVGLSIFVLHLSDEIDSSLKAPLLLVGFSIILFSFFYEGHCSMPKLSDIERGKYKFDIVSVDRRGRRIWVDFDPYHKTFTVFAPDSDGIVNKRSIPKKHAEITRICRKKPAVLVDEKIYTYTWYYLFLKVPMRKTRQHWRIFVPEDTIYR